ncbi:MAG TPA: hypothetical protein VGN46_01880 [Luteibacter sp.]|jgi:hypothetical protein|uniref:hypothetical protein n=1 Tax=Luteibacter sp. TaxID=1886636 RepID=UPI002F41BF90
MKYPRLIVSLALATTLASAATLAHPSTPQPQPGAAQPQQAAPATASDASSSEVPAFDELNKSGKGLVRSDLPKDNAALKEMRAHFPEADKDHNGRLDASEYNAYVHKGDAGKAQQ